MKVEIIYTDDYALIVSDEEMSTRDYRVNIQRSTVHYIPKDDTPSYYNDRRHIFKKVIAHRPLKDAPVLEGVSLLPEFSKEEDDVEKVAKKEYPSTNTHLDRLDEADGNAYYRSIFKKGYNKAKETYKYTEEDLRKALLIKHDGLSVDYVIQSLQTKRPKSILLETVGDTETINRCKNFNVEIGCVASKCTCENLSISKTIINSQGQTELKGEYSHE